MLETYPRDELFQIDDDTLFRFALTILQLDERPRVRVLPRRDRLRTLRLGPRLSCRAIATTATSAGRVGDCWPPPTTVTSRPSRRSFRKVRWCACTSSSPGARARRPIRTAPPWRRRSPASCALGSTACRRRLSALMIRAPRHGRWPSAIADAFSAAYREAFTPAVAVDDIAAIEALSPRCSARRRFHRREQDQDGSAALKVWSYGRPIPLSERVPVLEHMGFRWSTKSTYHVIALGARRNPTSGSTTWCSTVPTAARSISTPAKQRLEACLAWS